MAEQTTGLAEQAGANSPHDRPCVLLRNGNVVFGNAERIGRRIVIRQGDSGEVVVPTSAVACWAKSLRQLYQYRVDHRRGDRVETRLADARWCLRNGLIEEAFTNLAEVRRLDPTNRLAHVLMQQADRLQQAMVQDLFQNSFASDADPSEPASAAGEDSTSNPVRQASFDQTVDNETPQDFDADVLSQFTRDVQPLMLNRCAQCHRSGRHSREDVHWRLSMPAGGGRPSRSITRRNLIATLEQVGVDETEAMRFMDMATTAHGGSPRPPLRKADGRAIDKLIAWLQTVIQQEPTTEEPIASHATESTDHDHPITENHAPVNAGKTRIDQRQNLQPARLPVVADPFDPDRFNKQFHRQAVMPANDASER